MNIKQCEENIRAYAVELKELNVLLQTCILKSYYNPNQLEINELKNSINGLLDLINRTEDKMIILTIQEDVKAIKNKLGL